MFMFVVCCSTFSNKTVSSRQAHGTWKISGRTNSCSTGNDPSYGLLHKEQIAVT